MNGGPRRRVPAPSRRVRAAAAAGAVFGAVSMVAGVRVLTGIDQPGYVVLAWLVAYNIAAGALGVVAGAGVWLGRNWGLLWARLLAAAHVSVLAALVFTRLAGGAVASDSLGAMGLRATMWLVIAAMAARTSQRPTAG